MEQVTIQDIEPLVPFSRGTTEIFLTGQWSGRKPAWVEKTSPCRQACPIGNDIARAFAAALGGGLDEALRVFRQENPLPGVCGRVCYHPCESECNRREHDEAVNIRGFERYLADNGNIASEIPSKKRSQKVAVVGSGPAGLGAAYHLARLGFQVTIFEALPEPGGMLMYGIPEYRLPKAVLKEEIGRIEEMGVAIKTGIRIGTDISVADIRKDFQAVFLAIGAHRGMRLGVEGEDLSGVTQGITFLRDVNLGKRRDLGHTVAVIGGGNTAIDCARVAGRLGAREVIVVYRRSRSEMPALAEDVEAAQAEGVRFEFLTAPKRIIAASGRVSAVECLRMELGPPDGAGRLRPVPLEGSEYVIGADTVIAAVGQVPEADFLGDQNLVNERGMIDVSSATLPGVFGGGDCAGTRAFVADAIASGKMGALAIACFTDGMELTKELEPHRIGIKSSISTKHVLESGNGVDLQKVITYDKLNTICYHHAPRNMNPERITPQEAISSFEEVVGKLNKKQIEAEIERCFKCGTCTTCDLCFLVCPDISITKAGNDGYGVRTDYCKGCGVCAVTCPRQVIEMIGGSK